MKRLFAVIILLTAAVGCSADMGIGGANGVDYKGSIGKNGDIFSVDTTVGPPASDAK